MTERAEGRGPRSEAAPRALVLGIGNILWADEGFGVRCVEAMAARHRFADNVTLLDGGTQGLYLVDQVRAADVLVVFDAVDYGLPPGELKRVEGDDVPRFLGAKKMSLHQTGFQEVLALAALLGDAPSHLLLVGVQPEMLEDFGGSLRPCVKAQIAPAIDVALAYLAGFGVVPLAEGVPAHAEPPHPALDLAAYEAGRPSPAAACRSGDARVLGRIELKAGNC
jgi:hydrogenase maturation protease